MIQNISKTDENNLWLNLPLQQRINLILKKCKNIYEGEVNGRLLENEIGEATLRMQNQQ